MIIDDIHKSQTPPVVYNWRWVFNMISSVLLNPWVCLAVICNFCWHQWKFMEWVIKGKMYVCTRIKASVFLEPGMKCSISTGWKKCVSWDAPHTGTAASIIHWSLLGLSFLLTVRSNYSFKENHTTTLKPPLVCTK